jgi:hypothetical protein
VIEHELVDRHARLGHCWPRFHHLRDADPTQVLRERLLLARGLGAADGKQPAASNQAIRANANSQV